MQRDTGKHRLQIFKQMTIDSSPEPKHSPIKHEAKEECASENNITGRSSISSEESYSSTTSSSSNSQQKLFPDPYAPQRFDSSFADKTEHILNTASRCVKIKSLPSDSIESIKQTLSDYGDVCKIEAISTSVSAVFYDIRDAVALYTDSKQPEGISLNVEYVQIDEDDDVIALRVDPKCNLKTVITTMEKIGAVLGVAFSSGSILLVKYYDTRCANKAKKLLFSCSHTHDAYINSVI